jgi:hypothetical protein
LRKCGASFYPQVLCQVLGIVYRVISVHLVKKADYSKKQATLAL